MTASSFSSPSTTNTRHVEYAAGGRATRWMVLVVVAIGFLLVWQIAREAWVTDDAAINFRYSDNIISGHGAVYNLGERVRAYSSPLFLLILTPFIWLGVDGFAAAPFLGMGFTLVEFALFSWLAWRWTGSLVVPIVGAVLLGTDRIFVVWATGGLETSLYSLLLFVAFALCVAARHDVIASAKRSGVVYVLLAAARPEGLIFYPLYLFWVIWLGRKGGAWREPVTVSLRRAVPGLVLLYGTLYAYYGDIVAQSYASKVQGVPVVSIGLGYLAAFATRMGWTDPTYISAWVALAWLVFASGRVAPRPGPLRENCPHVAAVALSFLVLDGLAIVGMGGDYMTDFRFVRPAMGILYFSVALLVGLAFAVESKSFRVLASFAVAAFGLSHGLRQGAPTPVYWDAPTPWRHKRLLTTTRDQAERFRAALERIAMPGDALLTDTTGYRGLGQG